MILLFTLIGTTQMASAAGIKKVSITNPKNHPLLKEYFIPENQKYDKTDNGVQVYFQSKGTGYAQYYQLIAKKAGKTLWKKDFHVGVSLLGVERNLIFLYENNQNTAINGPSTLIVLNTQGKTIYRSGLNGAVVNDAYTYIRDGDAIYFVTDRFYDRLNEGGTTPGKLYSRMVAVSVKTGKILWTKGLGVANRPPLLYKGKIYVTDNNEGLFSFDAKGNKTLLLKDDNIDGQAVFSPKGYIYLTFFTDSNQDVLRAYDPEFRLLWSQPYDGFDVNLLVDDDLIFLSTYEYEGDVGRLYTINEKGKVLWTYKYKGYDSQGVVTSGNNVFFISRTDESEVIQLHNNLVAIDNRIFGFNKRTGALLYSTNLGSYSFATNEYPVSRVFTKNIQPIIEETSRTGKTSYYFLK